MERCYRCNTGTLQMHHPNCRDYVPDLEDVLHVLLSITPKVTLTKLRSGWVQVKVGTKSGAAETIEAAAQMARDMHASAT